MHNPAARAACLAWLYEGYRAWRNAGYALPESALALSATAEYWADMNPYEQFAADVGLKFGKLERCHKPRMTGAFRAWREETGRLDASLKGFPGWLKSQGCFDQQETGGGRLWYGVSFPNGKSPESPKSRSVPGNSNVGNELSKSTFDFPGTAGDSGYSGYRTPADALSSHLGDAQQPVDCGNSANSQDFRERKPPAGAGYEPVDNFPAGAAAAAAVQPVDNSLPAGAFADARQLWEVLRYVRGYRGAARLAQELGWNEGRVMAAAMELRGHGRASVNGSFIAPINPPAAGAGHRDRGEV